jgi:photosystem II stability/assembly factor-like uncharacterized protein
MMNGGNARLDFKPLLIHKGQTISLSVHAGVLGSSQRTFGLRIPHTGAVLSSNSGVTLSSQPTTNGLGYVGAVPDGTNVDGAFHDWEGLLEMDGAGEASLKGNLNVDIDRFSASKDEEKVFFYLSVVGEMMAGAVAPEGPRILSHEVSSSPCDSDRDKVPDEHDRVGAIDYSSDFDNDGTPDGFENGDIDGDGIVDFPGGPDLWLNTTIPASFPQPFAGREVSLFIGEIEKPPLRGEDLVRIYVDSDKSVSTGFSHQGLGADHLVEIRGRNGIVRESVLMSHKGSSGRWKWESIGDIDVAKHNSQMELAFEKSKIGVDVGETFEVVFEVMNWDMSSYDTVDGPLKEVTEDPFVLGMNGDIFQSVDGGSTWTVKGDAGGGSAYRAIIANLTGYLFVLRKNGDVIGSDDNGTTWSNLGDVGNYQNLIDMSLDGNDYLYVLRTGGEVYQSTDSGSSWSLQGDSDTSASSGFIGLTYDSSDYLYSLVENGTVYRSTDSGSSWDYRGDAGPDANYMDITTNDLDYLYILTSTGYVNESQDGGTSWSYQGDVGSETYTAIEWGFDSHLYALATTGEVYRSSDGGSVWNYRGDVGSLSDFSDFTALIPEFEPLVLILTLILFIPMTSAIRRRKLR